MTDDNCRHVGYQQPRLMHEFPLPYWRGGSWHPTPSVIKSGGPERVATEEPPDDWTPTPLLGFTAPTREAEPLLWDGDDA